MAPLGELRVQILEVVIASAQEEVVAGVAERAFHLALGLGPIQCAGTGTEPVVLGQLQQPRMVNHVTGLVLAQHRGLHPIVEDLSGHPAEFFDLPHVAAQHAGPVLPVDEPPGQPTAVTEHEREQPHHADPARLLGEVGLELRKIHLRLFARSGLKAVLEAPVRRWTDAAQIRGQL